MGVAGQQAIKGQYRVKNWHKHNKALKNRYSMTFWFDKKQPMDSMNQPNQVNLDAPKLIQIQL
ncbi:hypothetical protein ACQZV8_05230 [Magnetococcales bacterium HHB-1]